MRSRKSITGGDPGLLARLELAKEARGLDQKGLADAAGVSQANVSRWLAGKALPGADVLVRLPEALGVSGHWLLTGQGPMAAPTAKQIEDFRKGYVEGCRTTMRELAAQLEAAATSVGEATGGPWDGLEALLGRMEAAQKEAAARRKKSG